MTTFWPKRDEEGKHVSEPKPLSELLAKLDPDVVERARADANSDPADLLEGDDLHQYIMALSMWPLMPLRESIERRNKLAKDILNKNKPKCAKYDGYQIIALDGEIYNCECQE